METDFTRAPQAGRSMLQSADATIQPGTIFGSRFQVNSLLGNGGLGPLYHAIDIEEQKPIALRILSSDIAHNEEVFNALRNQIKTSSMLQHKNIALVFGLGKEASFRFIAMEYVDGHSLRCLNEKKLKSGTTFSPKSAYNVIAHVCNAVHHAHSTMVHGLIGPSSVLINRTGRVKICEFGMVLALQPGSNPIARLKDHYCIAPEIKANPRAASPLADIYSMGVLLFELLTGRPPSSPNDLPSRFNPLLGEEIDGVVFKCLQTRPESRFSSASELKSAFFKALEKNSRRSSEKLSANPSGPLHPAASGPSPIQSFPSSPGGISSTSPGTMAPAMASAPMMAKPPAMVPASPAAPPPLGASAPPFGLLPQPPAPQATASPSVATPVDPQQIIGNQPALPIQPSMTIEQLLAETGGDNSEKWLVQKNRLDFGPFSYTELKQQLYKQAFSGDDMVVDQETGERNRIRNSPQFRDFIIHLERFLEHRRIREAESERISRDRRRRTILIIVVLVISLGLIGGLGVTWMYLSKEPETKERIIYREKQENLGKMIKEIAITWKKEPEEQAKKRRRIARKRRGRKAGSKGVADNVTHLGDATKEGGDALLSQKVVQGVMAQNFNKLRLCVLQEVQRNSSLRQVLINFGVRGTGAVSSVEVNGKTSGPFHACIDRKMQTIKFPAYDGQLTRASFSMNLKY